MTLAAVALGLCTQTVVYQTAGATPGLAPTDGRKTSVPVNAANSGADMASTHATVTTTLAFIELSPRPAPPPDSTPSTTAQAWISKCIP